MRSGAVKLGEGGSCTDNQGYVWFVRAPAHAPAGRVMTRHYWPYHDLAWYALGLLILAWLVVPVLAGQP